MKLKNSEIVELAKFFLFDKSSTQIQYKFEAHKAMQKNFFLFREVFTDLSNLERSILSMKSSPTQTQFLEELKVEVSDYLQKDASGDLEESESGEVPIMAGCEDKVFKAQEVLMESEPYKEFFDSMKSIEKKLKETLSETNEEEITQIKSSDLNLDDLTLGTNQWNLISTLIIEDAKK